MRKRVKVGVFNMQLPAFCDVMNFLHIVSVLFFYCAIIVLIFYPLYKYDQWEKRIEDERDKDIE